MPHLQNETHTSFPKISNMLPKMQFRYRQTKLNYRLQIRQYSAKRPLCRSPLNFPRSSGGDGSAMLTTSQKLGNFKMGPICVVAASLHRAIYNYARKVSAILTSKCIRVCRSLFSRIFCWMRAQALFPVS